MGLFPGASFFPHPLTVLPFASVRPPDGQSEQLGSPNGVSSCSECDTAFFGRQVEGFTWLVYQLRLLIESHAGAAVLSRLKAFFVRGFQDDMFFLPDFSKAGGSSPARMVKSFPPSQFGWLQARGLEAVNAWSKSKRV